MGFFKTIIELIIIVGIFLGIAYYLNLFGIGNLISSYTPGLTVPNSQIINGSLGNIEGLSEYSSQYRVAEIIAKKYNEPIKRTILFTGNSSSMGIEEYNANDFSTVGTSDNMIDYDGLYVPIYENISDAYVSGSNYIPSLIGKTVYIWFNASYDNNSVIQVPYIVQSETIKPNKNGGSFSVWHLTQDTGVPDSTAINMDNESRSELNKTITYTIAIYYNGTEILFPTG